jgi:DNA-binding NarL/FixJ family response regulator
MGEENKINIVVTDDHALFRKGLSNIIRNFDFIESVEEASDGIELLKHLLHCKVFPDLVILDIKMPNLDGIETNKRLKEQYPNLKVIILSSVDEDQFILQMIKAGVSGYLLKNASEEELRKTITEVIENDYYYSDKITQLLHRSIVDKDVNNKARIHNKITARELEVLELICKEHKADEVAEMLNISRRTVEGHKRSLMEKTCTTNTVGLAIFAIRNGLVKIS